MTRSVGHISIALAELKYQRNEYAKLLRNPDATEYEIDRARLAVRTALKSFRDLKERRP